jgi:hypothetical protein
MTSSPSSLLLPLPSILQACWVTIQWLVLLENNNNDDSAMQIPPPFPTQQEPVKQTTTTTTTCFLKLIHCCCHRSFQMPVMWSNFVYPWGWRLPSSIHDLSNLVGVLVMMINWWSW